MAPKKNEMEEERKGLGVERGSLRLLKSENASSQPNTKTTNSRGDSWIPTGPQVATPRIPFMRQAEKDPKTGSHSAYIGNTCLSS